MDIHRSRFVPYPPSAINALAFSATDLHELGKGGLDNLRLAVGRANGDIEIWNPANGAWAQETVFYGGHERSVEGLVWIKDPDERSDNGKVVALGQLRLFSIGYSNTVTEWNLATGLPLREWAGNDSEVWCLAAQPRLSLQEAHTAAEARPNEYLGQQIVAGCADGTLALLSTEDNDLQFQKFLARSTTKKSRALCVAYKDRHTVVAGFANSCIRIFDTRNSTLIRQVTLGAGPKGGPREILCWSVKCLPNGDIVTGDSTGEVRFFEGHNYSQYQRIAGHDADVLDIETSADGNLVYSVGMDRRTVVYNKPSAAKERRWAKASQKTFHQHDVKALARFDSEHLSVMAAGGLDTNLVIIPITGFWAEHKREISSLPQLPRVASAPSTRLVMSWWKQEVNIWRLERPHGHKKDKVHKLVARIGLQGDENITDAAISADGSLLAVSTMANTRVFQLSRRKNDLDGGLKVRKIEPEIPLPGSRLLQLSPNGHWLSIVDESNQVGLVRLVHDTESELLRILPALIELDIPSRESKDERPTALDNYIHTITRLQFSPDGRLLVASDLSGHINSWIVEGHEDLTAAEVDAPEHDDSKSSSSSEDEENDERPIIILGQHWKYNDATKLLPKLKSAPIILSFRPEKVRSPKPEPNGNPAVHATRNNPHPISHATPEGPYELLVLTAQHELYEFDLLEGRLTPWSKRNPTSLLPAQFQKIRDRAMGSMWHTSGKLQRWWLYGSNWIFMLDLSQDFEEAKPEPHLEHSLIPETKKRKREDESGAGGKKARSELEGLEPKVEKFVDGKRVGVADKEHKKPLLLNGFAKEKDSEGEDEEEDGLDAVFDRDEVKPQRRRSILGMVDIGSTDGCLETVIVERPVFDLDLPPRLVGPNDR
ncbi:hypothetical protein BLS_008141 [Venturia inaequalis]|uniref:WD40 repeat-like protein n=1 Tax=Venturia inaequalis TaxID=5025 RepID=A0A8H3YQE6_VENIN|nr:hypothetical protein BLS_008141 [Venturia inaequalis]KAE9965756.1 hypothetical protein EG328_009417 [Venturia inaequalis]